jgi:hypothetical protein
MSSEFISQGVGKVVAAAKNRSTSRTASGKLNLQECLQKN